MKQFEEIKTLLGDSNAYYLIAVGMDATYTYVNKRYAEIFKPIHGELIGKHYAVTIHPEDQQVCVNVSQLAFMNPDAVFPATLRKHDGQGGFVFTRWEYKAMLAEDGSPSGIFCIGHDITALIQLTGELQQVKNSHAHLVRRHVANLVGLGKFVQYARDPADMREAAKMMVESAQQLDLVIKELYKQQ